MSFGKKTLIWRIYITIKALSTTKWVQIINKKDFIIVLLDIDSKAFVVDMAIWKWEEMPVHFKKQTQIGALLFDKAFTKILSK